MCLSTVYIKEENDRSVIVEEASSVVTDKSRTIEIGTLFGDKKVLNGYEIREINFLKNYITLEKTGA